MRGLARRTANPAPSTSFSSSTPSHFPAGPSFCWSANPSASNDQGGMYVPNPMHTLESAPVAARPVLETLVARSPTPGVPINLHAQMAHAPSVLIGYMAMRKALDEHGTFDPKTRTAIC